MLRKIRILFAVICFSLLTLLFLDFTGSISRWFGFLAKIQFLPAVLALNVGIIIAWVLLTLLFGRVYCSVVCPLGVLQDGISWLSGRRKKKKSRFSYSPALSWLRYGVWVLFVAAIVAGIGSFVALLDPYAAYGRIAQNLLAPVWAWGNNLAASGAESVGSYAFYRTEIWIRSLPTFIIAAAMLAVIAVLAWRNGRTYCNTVCPVGTTLGILSRFSLFAPVIDTGKCNGCKLCSRKCKASCIDPEAHKIDYSRCVACMDCLDNCKQGAITYGPRGRKSGGNTPFSGKLRSEKPSDAAAENRPEDESRRTFLVGMGMFAAMATVKAQEKKVDGGLAVILDKKIPERATPVVPPGSLGLGNMASHCTGCQLCVSVCPNGVLRPSTRITALMQPESSYERGYCRPECVKCSEVCPTGAIRRITTAEKSSIQIGHAIWIKANCVVLNDGVPCGNCARHCPVGAITMVASNPASPDSLKIPVVNEARCIGCGACENLCPARPFSAIYVEGHERHRMI